MRKHVVVTPYNSAWPCQFEALRSVIASALGETAVAIHHVGSTSVPGLAAKPIIDIDVEIESRRPLPDVIERLAVIGYEHQGDLGVVGREAFRNRSGGNPPIDGSGRDWPRHHLYVCASDNAQLARHLAFRDYLRAHPARVAACAELKISLARQFEYDMDSYIAGKSEFVEETLRLAGRVAQG